MLLLFNKDKYVGSTYYLEKVCIKLFIYFICSLLPSVIEVIVSVRYWRPIEVAHVLIGRRCLNEIFVMNLVPYVKFVSGAANVARSARQLMPRVK